MKIQIKPSTDRKGKVTVFFAVGKRKFDVNGSTLPIAAEIFRQNSEDATKKALQGTDESGVKTINYPTKLYTD